MVLQHMWEIADAFPVFFSRFVSSFYFVFFCFPFVSTFLVLPVQPRASGETRVDLFVS